MRLNHKKLLALGECMIELSHLNENTMKMRFAGDTLNTAVYLARYQDKIDTNIFYGTAIGCDPYSQQMLNFWENEGIDTNLVQKMENKLSGLYFIKTDSKGERTFYFYRQDSAARQFFHVSNIEILKKAFLNMDVIYFSAIGLAIWDEWSCTQLFDLIQLARQAGVLICFDSNYRPKLWPNKKIAQDLIQKAWSLSDIYLPTFEDHQALFGDQSPEALIHRLIHDESIKEVVVKAGAKGCLVGSQNQIQWIPAHLQEEVIDTTGAGDSFNAAYLAARLKEFEPSVAAEFGHRLAAEVIRFKGAIIPRETMPDLF